MGLFDVTLFDNDQLFNRLLSTIALPGETVAADLDQGSFEAVPFITHFSSAAQDQNSNGLWTGTLTVNVFADAADAFDVAKRFYAGIWGWNQPGVGVINGVGAITEVSDLQAFARLGGAVQMDLQMETKAVVQYVGSFTYAATNI